MAHHTGNVLVGLLRHRVRVRGFCVRCASAECCVKNPLLFSKIPHVLLKVWLDQARGILVVTERKKWETKEEKRCPVLERLAVDEIAFTTCTTQLPHVPHVPIAAGDCKRTRTGKGHAGFSLQGGGGSIEPPKTGEGEVREKGSIDRHH